MSEQRSIESASVEASGASGSSVGGESIEDRIKKNAVIIYFTVFFAGLGAAKLLGVGAAKSQNHTPSSARPSVADLIDVKSLMENIPVANSEFEIEVINFMVECDGASRVCSNYLEIFTTTTSDLKIRFRVGSMVCQPVKLLVYVTGGDIERVFDTGRLGWIGAPASLVTDTGVMDLGPLPEGGYSLRFQAEGLPDGCSADGSITKWGGTLRLVTST